MLGAYISAWVLHVQKCSLHVVSAFVRDQSLQAPFHSYVIIFIIEKLRDWILT